MTELDHYVPVDQADEVAVYALREAVFRIIESYTGCMEGWRAEEYVRACADDVLHEALGLPVTYAKAVGCG